MESDTHSGKIPAALQRELRSTLGSLGIKMTIAAEELKRETDAARAADLRDQIASLKAEAKTLVDKYKWAKTVYEQEIEAAERGAAPDGPVDDLLVFGDLDDLTSEPPRAAATGASVSELDDVELVLDLGATGLGAAASPSDAAADAGGLILDQVELSLSLSLDESPQQPRSARGGRLGEALALAAELAAGRSAEWGGPLLACLLSTGVLALERGADEDATIAALLHPALSQANEEVVLGEIRSTFGDRVVTLVAWAAWLLSVDPWEQRDRAYLKRMQEAPAPALVVSLCARLIAARAMTARRKAAGTGALDRPGRGRERLVWSLRAMVKAYRSVADPLLVGPLLDEWEAAVETVERATGVTGPN